MRRGVKVVDTTCPWVSKVWNAVDSHRKTGSTSVIHGKYSHEETIATASFCDNYIILKDKEDAEYVANYIINGGNKVSFLKILKLSIIFNFFLNFYFRKNL